MVMAFEYVRFVTKGLHNPKCEQIHDLMGGGVCLQMNETQDKNITFGDFASCRKIVISNAQYQQRVFYLFLDSTNPE